MAFVRTRMPARRLVRRGFGDAPCPSVEQLEGIVDATDPCQAVPLNAANVSSASAITSLLTPTVTAPVDPMSVTVLGIPMPYAVLGGVLLALVLVSGGGGGRRR